MDADKLRTALNAATPQARLARMREWLNMAQNDPLLAGSPLVTESAHEIENAEYMHSIGASEKMRHSMQQVALLQEKVLAEIKDQSLRSRGGKGRVGSLKPISATIREVLRAMALEDRGGNAVIREFRADTRGRENILTGLRESGITAISIAAETAKGFDYIDGDGKTASISEGRLRNVVSEQLKKI